MRISLYTAQRLVAEDIRGIAQRLIERKMNEDEAMIILSRVGIEADDAPVLVLSDLLALVVETMARMRALCRQDDIILLRQFFMGVLQWPPELVMHQASLEDLADAFTGYCAFHGLIVEGDRPQARFLQEMMNKFPDMKGKEHDKK